MTLAFLSAAPEGRMFGLDLDTLFIIAMQLVNFCILAAALSFILYKPLRNYLQKRAERIASQIEHAEGEMVKANEIKAKYEKSLADIEVERNEILRNARNQAQEQKKEILNEARLEVTTMRERATLDIANEQEQIKDALRLHILEVSVAMAEKLVGSTVDKQIQDRLFAETMKELEELPWPT